MNSTDSCCGGFLSQCLEELDLSLNPLGDGVSESLSCLLSCCPLLAKLSLQACGLTARFLQQHRLLLASALTGNCNKVQSHWNTEESVLHHNVMKNIVFAAFRSVDVEFNISGSPGFSSFFY